MVDSLFDTRADLQKLAVFAAVADRGGFTAAARELGVTKAAVSKQVNHLEAKLGARLLHRTTRKVRVTELGERVLAHVHQMLAEADAIAAIIGEVQHEPAGELRVAAPIGLGQRLVAPAVASFARLYPRVRVELTLDDSPVDLVERSIDVAVRGGRLADSSLKARRLAELELVPCASPVYLERAGEPRTPSDLTDHAWLVFTPLGRPQRITFTGGGKRSSVRLDGRLATDDGETLRLWLVEHLGVALLPAFWVERDLAEGRLRRVLPRHRVRGGAIHAVHPYDRQVPSKVRRFIDHLQQAARRL